MKLHLLLVAKLLSAVALNLTFGLFQVIYAQSQMPKSYPVTPKSPNAAAMERYGNYEVNLFHGLPQISIPIYEIKTKNLTLPITLNYHASGIKVTDVASWAGLGWNLNAGGQITRKVKGKPDESGGFLSANFSLRTPSQIDPYTLDGYTYLRQTHERHNDGEPDIFSYVLPGKSGHFFHKNSTEQPIFVPYVPYVMQRTHDAGYTGQFSFKLTDEIGNKYHFGKSIGGEEAREFSQSTQGGNTEGYFSSWLLTNIVSPDDKDNITLNYYSSNNVTLLNTADDYVSVLDNVQENSLGVLCTTTPYIHTSFVNKSYSVSQQLMKEILFDNGKVEFILKPSNRNDLNAPALSKINVFSKVKSTYQLLKSVQFHYSYFGSGSMARLKLDSLSVSQSNGVKAEVYRFTYNTSINLPEKNSKSIDSWGYFNNRPNSTLLPRTSISYHLAPGGGMLTTIGGEANAREPNPSAMDACVLRRIQYPMGGHTIFHFEPNKYIKGGEELFGGGLRIKAIYNYPEQGSTPIIKTYIYGTAQGVESGFGYLNSQTPLYYKNTEQYGEQWLYGGSSGDPYPTLVVPACMFTTRVYSSNPVADNNDFDETNVYYPFVTEYLGTPGSSNGKTTYLFTNPSDQLITAYMDIMPYAETRHWQRGKLISKKVYERAGAEFLLRGEVFNTYKTVNPSNHNNMGLLISEVFNRTGPVLESVLYSPVYPLPYKTQFYSLMNGSYQMENSLEKTYDSGQQQVVNNTSYSYNDKGLISVIKTVKSDGDTLVQQFKYPSDYQSVNASGDARGFMYLKSLNLINTPVESITGSKAPGGVLKINNAMLKTYHETKPVIKDEYFLQNAVPATGFALSTINSAGNLVYHSQYEKRISYPTYDTNNNPLEYYVDDPSNKTALIWGYNYSMVTAEIRNASSQQIAYTSFEESGKGNWTYDESAVKKMVVRAVSDSSVFEFASASSKQISKLNVPAGTYVVSYWGTVPCQVNGTGAQVLRLLASKGINLYSHIINLANSGGITVTSNTAVIDDLSLAPVGAQVKLFSHRPGIGLTSVSMPNRSFITYRYDGLQRLREIRNTDDALEETYGYHIPSPKSLGAIPTYYYNTEVSAIFKKNNCPSGYYGSSVKYVVSANTYISIVSQQDAQNQAAADLNANGQTYANRQGECRSNTEEVWEPIDPYCQVRSLDVPTPTTAGYGVTVASVSGTNDYTQLTVTRNQSSYRAKVTIEIYFTGGNKITADVIFNAGTTSVQRTVGVAPYLNANRTGAWVVAVENTDQMVFTGYQVYEKRQKRVGGVIVLTEANLRNAGQGSYFGPVATTYACQKGYVYDTQPTRTAYSSVAMSNVFYKVCPTGKTGSAVTYTVEIGKYTSSISQEDADNKARNELNTNGQNYANQNGACY